MPPPDLPYHYQDVDIGFDGQPLIRRDWKRAIKTYGPIAAGGAAVLAKKAIDYVWGPTDPKADVKLEPSLFSQETMGGNKHLRGNSAGASFPAAKKMARSVNGTSATNSLGVVPAMFQGGRGAEVPGIVSNYHKPLKRYTKSGPPAVDAAAQQRKAYKGAKVSENFAFKMIMPARDYAADGISADVTRVTRFVVNNVFRHKNSAANDPNPAPIYKYATGSTPPILYVRDTSSGTVQVSTGWTGMRTGQNTIYEWEDTLNGLTYVRGTSADWNYTLGPDKSFVRKQPPEGSAQDLLGPGLSSELMSPYRAPQNGTYMYSTLTMQALENIGWNLNPMKFRRPQNTQIGAGSGPNPQTLTYDPLTFINSLQPPLLYPNAPVNLCANYDGASLPFGSGARDIEPMDGYNKNFAGYKWARSFPNLQTYSSLSTSKQPFDGMVVSGTNSEQLNATTSAYQSQFGPGSVHYTFANNGSCPVILDVVVHTIKKGKVVNTTTIPILNQTDQGINNPSWSGYMKVQNRDSLALTYGAAYMGQQLAQNGGTDLNGRPPLPQDVYFDAKTPFIPATLLTRPHKPTTTAAFDVLDLQANWYAGQPYKQDLRDQFVVAAGAQRSWSFTLPSMNYYSPSYRQGGGPTDIEFGSGVITGQDAQISSALSVPATGAGVDQGPIPGNDWAVCDDLSYIVTLGCSAIPMPVLEATSGSVVDRSSGGINVSVTGTYSEMPLPVYVKEKHDKWNLNGALSRPAFDGGNVDTTRVDLLNLGSAHYAPGENPYVPAEPLTTDPLS